MMKIIYLLLVVSALLLSNHSAKAVDPKADFLKMIDRPRVPLAPVVEVLPTADGLKRYHVIFASEAETRVPFAGEVHSPVIQVKTPTLEVALQIAQEAMKQSHTNDAATEPTVLGPERKAWTAANYKDSTRNLLGRIKKGDDEPS